MRERTTTPDLNAIADPKITAKRNTQAKQIFIDFTEEGDRMMYRNNSLTGITESANTAVK